LLLKHVENVARQVAVLGLGSKWVCSVRRSFFVAQRRIFSHCRRQGMIRNKLEVGEMRMRQK